MLEQCYKYSQTTIVFTYCKQTVNVVSPAYVKASFSFTSHKSMKNIFKKIENIKFVNKKKYKSRFFKLIQTLFDFQSNVNLNKPYKIIF